GRVSLVAHRAGRGHSDRPHVPYPGRVHAAPARRRRGGAERGSERSEIGRRSMEITPDQLIYWRWGPVTVNATLVWTWAVMALLVIGSWALSRGLRTDGTLTRGQNLLEAVVSLILDQIRAVLDGQ